MSDKQKIKHALKKVLENTDEKFCIVATVDSIDESTLTAYCIPIEEGKADLPDVRLVSDTSKIGFVKFPKIGATVIVSFLNNEAGYIADCNEVDKVYLNGSAYNGLIKIDDLTTDLNTRQTNLLTAIIVALSSIDASIVALGGASNSSATFSATTTTTVTTYNKTSCENTTVKHGSGT